MQKYRVITLCLLTMASSGCIYNTQKANIAPTIDVASSNIGNGQIVGFRVQDERPSTSLGHRGSNIGAAAEITASQDVAAVFHDKIIDGLTKRGFHVVSYSNDQPVHLSVEIRDLTYSTSTGFWTGGVNVTGAIKAIAANGSKSYEQFYRSDKTKRVVFEPTASKNEDKINAAASNILQQMFDDQGLFKFLSSNHPTN